VKRHILARCGSAAIVSETTWRFYEAWVLERAFELGLDYSPLVGRQESFGPTPPLPPALPNLRIVRNPLPPWIMPLLEAGAGGRGFTRLPECSRASPEWPHANLRQQFRGRINATDEDYVLILVGTNIAHKGTARLVSTFARAWQQVGSMPGAPGRLLLVCIGQDMLNLAEEVRQAWAGLQPTRQPEAAEGEAVPAANTLPAAIHLLDGTANSTERLGWYAAADVQVLNSECESFGRVTVEGMAASLPLLATACGGTLELVQEGVTGLLHPSPSTGEASDAALLQHILRLDRRTAAGRTLAERLGAAGCRRTHSEFLPRQFLSTVEALLQQVAGTAAVANAEAAAGLGVAPSEGLTPGAAGPLRSGWAAAFMPTPANQAQVVQRDMRWSWEEHGPAPLVASESKSFQVGSKLFILSGDVQFLGGAGVVPQALVSFDLGSQQWQNETVALPPELAETHVGTALVGGRYVFIVAGQKGSECSPATTAAFRLDLRTMTMQPIPSLPEPRYSPALALLGDGRLHLFGGLMPDRATPARDHWSLAVNADGSTGDAWVAEPLLPAYLGGSHGTVVELHLRGDAEPTLYYWGRISQEAQPRDAAAGDFFCTANREWGDAALWSFNLHRGWRRHRDLPLPLQHTAGCTVKLGQGACVHWTVVAGLHHAKAASACHLFCLSQQLVQAGCIACPQSACPPNSLRIAACV
jgi:glycosyltransferase involved in cell wall biosynthesis